MSFQVDLGILVFLLSTALLALAAIWAYRIFLVSRFVLGWGLLAGALALMTLPYFLTLDAVFKEGRQLDASMEGIALAASLALAAGIVLVGSHFQKLNGATKKYKSPLRRFGGTQKLESLGALASGVTHHFTDQLTTIIGHTDLLMERSKGDEEVLHLLDGIVQASRSATALCHDMMAFSGELRMKKSLGDLNKITEEGIARARHVLSPRITLDFKPASIPVCTRCDVAQVRVALLNLLHNALEAIGSQAGEISIKTGVINCSAEKLARMIPGDPLDEGTYCVFEIRDNGRGIEEGIQARIFDPFFSTKEKHNGLGLTTVLGIVRGHFGGIEMNSAAGKGSVFRLYLPAASQEEVVELSTERSDYSRLFDHGVLIVDDVESVRFITGELLHNEGMHVHRAQNLEEAIDVLQSHSGEIDILLMDLNLSYGPDWDAVRRLRAISPKVRFVVTSGFPEPAGIRGDDRFYAAFLPKPYNREALLTAVDDALL